MTFVIKRKIDELGRLVLPIDHRNHYEIAAGDPLLVTDTGDGILVRKAPVYTDEVKIVDELGRVVIPKRIRENFNLVAKSVLNILATEEGILLKPDTTEPSTTKAVEKAPAEPETPGTYDIYEKDYRQISVERFAFFFVYCSQLFWERKCNFKALTTVPIRVTIRHRRKKKSP